MADVVVNSDNLNPKDLYAQGVRAFVLQDYSAAVAALSQAIEMLVAEHKNDLHESLGEVYLYYGKALLGLSREESEALGDAVPKNEDSEEEEEEEEGEEENGEKNENANNEAKESETNKKDEPMESTNEATNDEPSSSNGTTVVADAEDEPTDLQVAWEVLELAKKIFQKQGESSKKNLAETLTVLGEVSLESENFESAINDIKEGLGIQIKIFAKDSRTVAETYYKLGIAYSTNSQIEEAIKSFNNSLEYLKSRIISLEDKNEDEIKEIKNLIPDIEEKITDMKSYKDEALKKIVSAVTEAEIPSSSSKPATNISHLVKRKRKLDDVVEENQKESGSESNPAKKVNSE